ncbi:MAG TPA: trypsin-like peptidase domain-containing protein [Chloroflexota bacterium]|nr:trypsin-like peptidase domain-containing protein [Chloroflexota bacterium]
MDRQRFWLGGALALLLIGGPGCELLGPARANGGGQPAPATPTVAAPTAPPAASPPTAQPVAAQRPGATPTSAAPARTAPGNAGPTSAAPGSASASAVGARAGGLSVRQVVDRVKPAVVQIVTDQGAAGRDILGNPRGTRTGIGSGIIYDQQGHILTNHHVVAGARDMAVALPDGRTFDARVLGTDPETDLAVIQIQGDNLPAASLGDSDKLGVGDAVVAIGNALGLPGGPTVTAGVVSALGRSIQEPTGDQGEPGAVLYDAIQTDAAINPGNSGGPLVDMSGQVIGINTMIAGMAEPGVPAQGIGFAIAISSAKPVADQLATTGRAVHPYIGIAFQWAGGASARQLRSTGTQGVLVQRVAPNSPAAKAGLQQGDIITAVDGQKLTEEAALPKYVQKHKSGDTIQLTVVRNGQERTVPVTLADRPANT